MEKTMLLCGVSLYKRLINDLHDSGQACLAVYAACVALGRREGGRFGMELVRDSWAMLSFSILKDGCRTALIRVVFCPCHLLLFMFVVITWTCWWQVFDCIFPPGY